jgi:hypothetical protein
MGLLALDREQCMLVTALLRLHINIMDLLKRATAANASRRKSFGSA